MRAYLLALLLRAIIRLWLATLRFERRGPIPKGPGVVAFWHGHQLPLLAHRPTGELCAPISLSADGRLQKMIMAGFGIQAVDGSSSRGGLSAARHLLRRVRSGEIALIAVDGPRGPREVAKTGAAFVASRGAAPLWVAGVAVARAWVLRSTWDEFILPYPFSRITVVFDGPFSFDSDEKSSTLRTRLQARMAHVCQRARQYLNA